MYNFQLSNQPAEELADVLIASGKGAFDQCFFVSGGMYGDQRLYEVLSQDRVGGHGGRD